MFNVVVDTNVLVSAAISPLGPSAQILALAQQGEIELAVSPTLIDELADTLGKQRLRRWISPEEVSIYVDAITLLARWFDDRPTEHLPLVCDDPDDNFLIGLYLDAEAHMLISGDAAVRRVIHPNVHIYTPVEALEAIAYQHSWAPDILPGDEAAIARHIDAEGNRALINVYVAFDAIIRHGGPNTPALLSHVVVPHTAPAFIQGLDLIREMLAERGLRTRPIFASPSIAYLKLPPDPVDTIRATNDIRLPDDTIFATLQHCPRLDDPPGMQFDHWRIFGVGSPVPPEQISPSV